MKRPMVWLCLLCILFFGVYRYFYGEEDDKRFYIYGDALGAGQPAKAQGRVDRLEKKTNSYYLYLTDVSIQVNREHPSDSVQYLSKLVLCFQEEPMVLPGNRIQADGNIQDFDTATNPGQFDARSYYREQGVFYQMFAERYLVLSEETDRYQLALWGIKARLERVITDCLPEKEAGVVAAMLLGDRSALDMDVKELYQQNGIGHLLAISGLHISILCLAFYQLLLYLHFPNKAAVLSTFFVLYSYGSLTGFGISVNRAVIMMMLYLAAGVLGRTYDFLSAMALSALLILLQKPFAITSCSFLLSYAAVLGIALVYPVLQECVYGDAAMRRKRKRRLRRQERELKAQGYPGLCKWWFLNGIRGLLQTLLMSVAIQLSTLPVMLFFYYEVPTYGVVLNLFVLPLASLLLALAALAALLGLFSLPLAGFLFGAVSLILHFYEALCRLFLKLPMPLALIGRPGWPQIIACLFIFMTAFCLWRWRGARRLPLYLWTFAVVILIFPPIRPGLSVSFLDVGQGDGIVMHSPGGKTFLIDGGSSSEKNIGKYRIEPYLKYHGIRRIDYMIMTHADADHISGQIELLEQSGEAGKVQVGQLILPEPAVEYQEEEGYQQLLSLAGKARIPIQYIHTGDMLQLADLRIRCIHPDAGFQGDSANAYSTTLDVSYGSFRMLLCGDLEGAGEQTVLERLKQEGGFSKHPISVLKVAHHGSNNSTTEELLEILRPKISVISCGKGNRYGHPHPELLERLGQVETEVWRTDEAGAVLLAVK